MEIYLRCGILVHGFARTRCDSCGHERLIASSTPTITSTSGRRALRNSTQTRGLWTQPLASASTKPPLSRHSAWSASRHRPLQGPAPLPPPLSARAPRGHRHAHLGSRRWHQPRRPASASRPRTATASSASSGAGARPPFALERLHLVGDRSDQVLYVLPKPDPTSRTALRLSALEFLDRLANPPCSYRRAQLPSHAPSGPRTAPNGTRPGPRGA